MRRDTLAVHSFAHFSQSCKELKKILRTEFVHVLSSIVSVHIQNDATPQNVALVTTPARVAPAMNPGSGG